MRIEKLFVYPVKSLRAVEIDEAEITPYGFKHDRRFLLVKLLPDGKNETLIIGRIDRLCLFTQNLSNEYVTVTFTPPKGEPPAANSNLSIAIPLEPSEESLATVHVTVQRSSCHAFDMGNEYGTFFTSHLQLDAPVRLCYLGSSKRKILGNLSPNAPVATLAAASAGWLSAWLPSSITGWTKPNEDYALGLADCAHYLIANKESLDDLGSRLPEGMDITKLRPNILVSGTDGPWTEDFWGAIEIDTNKGDGLVSVTLTSNCVRCKSLNVDYHTGAQAAADHQPLKKLMKDRRVDKGSKWSPVFGRYGFTESSSYGRLVTVRDTVRVARINSERTTMEWPGISDAPAVPKSTLAS